MTNTLNLLQIQLMKQVQISRDGKSLINLIFKNFLLLIIYC